MAAGRDLGLDVRPQEYPDGTRTAADAARAVGVPVGAIVKSLVFAVGAEPVMALVSGANTLDEAALGRLAGGSTATRLHADSVRAATGFGVGGVPPFGHRTGLRTFVDEDVLAFDKVWAAAGTPSSCFPVAPSDLARVTDAVVGRLRRRADEDSTSATR